MGLGKTVSTLSAIDALQLTGEGPALVLAPLRVAQSTWPDEVKKWDHLRGMDVVPIVGTPAQRLKALRTDAAVHTINYEGIPWLIEQGVWKWSTVVADESTRLKSFRLRQGGQRAQMLARVAHTQVSRWINLTGTPAPNGLKDLWGQTWFLDRGQRLGSSYTAFDKRWFQKDRSGFGMLPLPHAQREIQERLADVCLTVDKGLDVDRPIISHVEIDLPRKARQAYVDMEKTFFAELGKAGAIEASNAAVRSGKLLQLANGAVYTDDDGSWAEIHDEKIRALESVIEEASGAPVLVAYHFRSDLARLQRAFPSARVLDKDPATIREWNAGRIPILLAHPACLHPSTEVLTEHRGWVKIVDVKPDERVFDGIEFVEHSGCHFSGHRPVIERLGLTLTANHKLLIDGEWTEAKDVRNTESARRAARYVYAGDDAYLSAMLSLSARNSAVETKRGSSKPNQAKALRFVHKRNLPQHDQYAVLEDLEGHEVSCDRPQKSGLLSLRRRRAWPLPNVVRVRKLLRRHVRNLPRRIDHRTCGQHERVQQNKLSLGHQCRAAGEQKQQSRDTLSGSRYAFSRVLSDNRRKPRRYLSALKPRHVCGRGFARLRKIDVPKKPQVTQADVYDLVDCGPRHRFLVRNAKGEVFISHNSAGHGLNLQDGGHHLVFFSLSWSLEEHDQIIERIGPTRQKQAGHDRPVYLYYILASYTMDETVLDRLQNKRDIQTVLMEAMARRA